MERAPGPGEAAEPSGAAVCPRCGEPTYPGEAFCENCGADLGAGPASLPAPAEAAGAVDVTGTAGAEVPAPAGDRPAGTAATCASCGGMIAADGYCATCGAPAVRERDHWRERPADWLAAVCDRGIRHRRNEDAVAVAAAARDDGPFGVLVVCDGVSTSADSDVASLAAARAARDVLAAPDAPAAVAARIDHWTRLLGEAADAANEAVVAVTTAAADRGTGSAAARLLSPPSCTLAAAVVDTPVIVIGAVGDSRVYWLPDEGEALQLSVDDSWAAEAIAAGVPREEAETGPRAHAITRWLGVDSPNHRPRCAAVVPAGPGWLLVCSDGLWNYCSEVSEMAALVGDAARTGAGDPGRTAERLVAWANERGGRDNISVGLARIVPAHPA